MDVLVTGSAGFLGRHFVAAVTAAGHEVSGIDIAADCADQLGDAVELFRHGARSYDLVIHCAAVAPHRSAIDGRPLAVGAGNLELDSAMFQWAARTKPGRVVYFSSSAAYPMGLQTYPNRLALREADGSLGSHSSPDAIYGWVKLTGERVAEAYRAQGGAVTVVRPFSGYGEDQSSDFPFGAFRDRARRRDDPFVIWGNGDQVRDWIHVDDVVDAVLAAVRIGVDGPVNLCTGEGRSMFDLAQLFVEAAGYEPEFHFLCDKSAGVDHRVGDSAMLRSFYRPRISIDEGVRRALAVESAT